MVGLSDIHVIETLDDYGFTRRSPSPWRGEDLDKWDSYPVEISALPNFKRRVGQAGDAVGAGDNAEAAWASIGERINQYASRPERLLEFPPDHGRGWCGVIMPRVWLRSRLG